MPNRILKKRRVETDVLTLARERVAHAYERFDHIAVSFSGGKDSTVCLNLTLEEARSRNRLPLDVFFYDEEAIPYETEEYVRRVSGCKDVRLHWYTLPVKHRNGCSRSSPWWYPWHPECPEGWVRELPEESIGQIPGFRLGMTMPQSTGLLFDPREHGSVGMIMGIRADESRTRQAAVSRKVIDNYIVKYDDLTSRGNVHKVYPIYDWSTRDVWTAPATLGWDYNRAYDLMDKAGISSHSQRCAPPFGEEPMQSLWTFHVCFPNIWDKLSTRVPGASTAARYARTELYGLGSLPSKPEDISWPTFLSRYIQLHEPHNRAVIANRIKEEIESHYVKTSDPILDSTPHPLTGMRWTFLQELAMRGDIKGRRKAYKKVEGKDRGVLGERYEAERRNQVEPGRW